MSQVEFKVDGEWMMEEDNMEEVDSLYTLYFILYEVKHTLTHPILYWRYRTCRYPTLYCRYYTKVICF